MELEKNIPCTEKQTGDQLKKLKLKLKIDRSHQNLPKMRERENYDGDGVDGIRSTTKRM